MLSPRCGGAPIRSGRLLIFAAPALAASALFLAISVDPRIYAPGAHHVHIGFGFGVQQELPAHVQADLAPRRVLRKLYSVVAFAIIGLLAAPLLPGRPGSAPHALRAAAVVASYSAVIELAQRVIDHSPESTLSNVFDIACGALGGALGSLAFAPVARYLGRRAAGHRSGGTP